LSTGPRFRQQPLVLFYQNFRGTGWSLWMVSFLYSDLHQFPKSPVFITFKRGNSVEIRGDDRLLVSRLTNWLDTIKDGYRSIRFRAL
jgi:hypothetical protein